MLNNSAVVMEVAIGEYGTDIDTLAEAAESRCKQVDSKEITKKTGKSIVSSMLFAHQYNYWFCNKIPKHPQTFKTLCTNQNHI